MENGKAPPSAHERDQLIQQRKRDLPRPSPAPAPSGMGAPVVQRNLNADALNKAKGLERRIQEIDKALHKERGAAQRDFSRGR